MPGRAVCSARTVRPDPSTLGVGETEAPTTRAARRPVSGRLFGPFQDPAEVVGATVDDRDGDDAGHLVGVLPLGAVDDLRQEAPAGAQGDSVLSWTWPCQR
jgi:hypothetical protein